MQHETLLQQPAARAARVVALTLLDDACSAALRLRTHGRNENDEALHDFRVALRRVRSWLRAWEPRLADSVSGKTRRRLGKIARATGPARDAEVHLAWLREQRSAFRGRQRAGVDWMITSLEQEQPAALDGAIASARDFEAVQARLTKELHSYTLRLHPNRKIDDDAFGTVLGELTREYGAVLRRRLGAIHEYGDKATAHRARIAAKRLRYLLEPVVGKDDDGAAISGQLAALQDVLGGLHDVSVFSDEIAAASAAGAAEQALRVSEAVIENAPATELQRERAGNPGPGLLAIVRALNQRGMAAFEELRTGWLGEASEPFFARLDALAEELTGTRRVE